MSGYLGTEIKRNTSNTVVRFRDIPVCKYNLSIFDEKRIYATKDFLRIYRDMVLIREFEIMLLSLQSKGVYRGVSYPLQAPVACDIGREALSVGEAYCADPADDMFSSEGTIADLMAKGLSAIEKLSETDLAQIMKGYHKGDILAPLAEITDKRSNVKDVALSFLLYGLLSEIFGKSTGFCYGLRGSKNVYFKPFGYHPCNMSGSDSAGLALGAALYRQNRSTDGCVIANMNANALFDGRVLEAFSLAESDVLRAKKNEGLPILFTLVRAREADESATSIRKCMARICAGIGNNSMYAETVNGSDPLAVIDAVSRKKELLKRGEGTVLLEMVCDSLQENLEGVDPVKLYREKLIRHGIAGESDLKKLEAYISDRVEQICRLCADDEKSPPAKASCGETEIVNSADETERMVRKIMPDVKKSIKDCKRWQAIQKKYGETSVGENRYSVSDALFEPILHTLYRDPDFVVFGMDEKEEILSGLSEAVDANRLLRSSVSPNALVSCALGYVLRGGRAVVSLDGAESLTMITDVLSRQITKWRLSGDSLSVPLVLYVPLEKSSKAQASEMAVSLVKSIPGLKVIYPVTPCDAKGLMFTALKEDAPVVIFERKNLYFLGESFEENGVPKGDACLPIGKPDLKREGNDLTILTVGAALYTAVKASDILSKTHGVEAEILNARTIVPFDYEPVLRSVAKTGKLLIVGEAPECGCVLREFAAVLGEAAFDLLDAPVIVMGADSASENVLTETDVIRTIHQKIIPLKGI